MKGASVARYRIGSGDLTNLIDILRHVRARAAVTASVAFGVAMLVYLRTMMPGPAFMDTGEFQTVTYVLGIAHPTGYPLYTILGKLFGTFLPVGPWAFRVNLMSA